MQAPAVTSLPAIKRPVFSQFLLETVTRDHSYATGGNSNYEYLGEARKLNNKLTEIPPKPVIPIIC